MVGLANVPKSEDFDDKDVYDRCDDALLQAKTQNFVIQFDAKTATCALDVREEAMREVLETDRPRHSSTRWISIWGPEYQKRLVKMLADRYNFSPRLLGIMCSDHNKPVPVSSTTQQHGRARDKRHPTARVRPADTQSSDPEKNVSETHARDRNPMFNMSHYKVVNEVWHYCSIDLNPKYLCLGYNSLSDTTAILGDHHTEDTKEDPEATAVSGNKPKGARKWTWLVLCDDGTIISIFETPFPDHRGALTETQQSLLCAIRRNLHNVFKQLSKVNDAHRKDNPINTLDIRPGLESNQQSNIKIADSPSILFYYLFDDWYTSYALVAKSEHQYAHQLETLRKDMFAKPHVTLINQLHQYGRELAVLKRMYQSYALIIERVLSRQKPVNVATARQPDEESRAHTRRLSHGSNAGSLLNTDVSTEVETLGVPLSSVAIVRFERLLDRINLYALSEIQECLDEKESLVFLNFNLLTMKESQAVERLTRITILLAKVTILFMPVSIMTAYFSTQLSDLANRYTTKTYWICFTVIMTLSFLFLMVFGLVSGTLEGKPIYRSLMQTVWDIGQGRLDLRRLRKNQRKTK